MKTATRTQINTALRDEWLYTIDALTNQIADWVRQEPGWTLEKAETQTVEEAPLGQYTVPVWTLHAPAGEARLEPIARNYPGRGILQLYAWPTAYRVRLIQDMNGGWRVLTNSGIYLHQPWDQHHFLKLVRELIGAEDMIAIG